MPEAKPMEIVRQFGEFYCVKSRRKYYCVGHDPAQGKTWAILSSDRVNGEYRMMRSDEQNGWTREAVEWVAKPHKRTTAISYFNAFVRAHKRKIASEVKAPARDEEDAPMICSWCNGSGQDPRNIEWACQKC